MDRRRFLTRLALGVLGAALGSGAVVAGERYAAAEAARPRPPRALTRPRPLPRHRPEPVALPPYFPRPQLTRIPLPGGRLYSLPGEGNLVALTVDDGTSSEVVRGYAEFAERTGMRITFFVTAAYPSWRDNAAILRPLVERGQVQLANHTWNHPDLTTIPAGDIRRQLERCGEFLRQTYGVEAAPYFRPPYGNLDAPSAAAAASVGYTAPVLWYGTLGDSGAISHADLTRLARQWLTAQRIVIGHANVATVLRHFDEIAQLIWDRGLQPVTLDDVFLRS